MLALRDRESRDEKSRTQDGLFFVDSSAQILKTLPIKRNPLNKAAVPPPIVASTRKAKMPMMYRQTDENLFVWEITLIP
jgi:hypothetical protein